MKKYMNHSSQEDGSVLVTTLLILVVINLLAIGLMQSSVQESKLANFKTLDSAVFHVADSCVQDSMKWLGDQTTPSTTQYVINQASISHMFTGTETAAQLLKLSNYSYNCTTDYLTVVSVSGDSDGAGEEIGESSGYGAAGDLSPRYYYNVVSNGVGPQNSRNTIYATVSVEY